MNCKMQNIFAFPSSDASFWLVESLVAGVETLTNVSMSERPIKNKKKQDARIEEKSATFPWRKKNIDTAHHLTFRLDKTRGSLMQTHRSSANLKSADQ